MRKTALVTCLIVFGICTPAFSKTLTLCEFNWGTSYLDERVAIFFDERTYDINYYNSANQPTLRPHGGIQFAVNLGMYSDEAQARYIASQVNKVTFKNKTDGVVFESTEANVYMYLSYWYASHTFVIGNSGRVAGDWEVTIHTINGLKYSGSFTIDGSVFDHPAPVPAALVDIQDMGDYIDITFTRTNAERYYVRVFAPNGDDILYSANSRDEIGISYFPDPNPTSRNARFRLPSTMKDKVARIEARFVNGSKNPFPSLSGVTAAECAFVPNKYVVRSATYFKVTDLSPVPK
jgi:hypothetical protein